MSDNDKADDWVETEPPKPPTVEVARPDIAAPRLDSLGRSMANKRGRKPANAGASTVNAGQTLSHGGMAESGKRLAKELKSRLPTDIKSVSDEMVGEAIAGAFAAIGLVAGPHWRLFTEEKVGLGEAFGPLARLYGPDELAKYITVLMTVPIVATVMAPRVAIQGMIARKEVPKGEGRSLLLQIKGMMAAEETLNIEQQAIESAAMLKATVNAGMQANADMKVADLKRDGMAGSES